MSSFSFLFYCQSSPFLYRFLSLVFKFHVTSSHYHRFHSSSLTFFSSLSRSLFILPIYSVLISRTGAILNLSFLDFFCCVAFLTPLHAFITAIKIFFLLVFPLPVFLPLFSSFLYFLFSFIANRHRSLASFLSLVFRFLVTSSRCHYPHFFFLTLLFFLTLPSSFFYSSDIALCLFLFLLF